MSGGVGKKVMTGINLLLLAAVLVGAYIGWGKIQASNARVNEINRLQRLLGERQWQAAIDGFETLFAQHPETRAGYVDQLAQAYQFLAADAYQEALGLGTEARRPALTKVVADIAQARELGPLSEETLYNLCDCHIALEQYDQALAVIAEAERREDVNAARFYVHKAFIDRKMKK
jgi:tetratricopeptide (TPR) repeat protein